MRIPIVAYYQKAAQGVGSGYIPHLRVSLKGKRRDGTTGWLRPEFNSPRLRLINRVQEPWLDEARVARVRRRTARWAKRHGYVVHHEMMFLDENDPIYKWYTDVA